MRINYYGLDYDEVYDLIRKPHRFVKCNCCDNNGYVYYDGKTGEGVNNSPSGIDPEWLAKDKCEDCNGYGYYLIMED